MPNRVWYSSSSAIQIGGALPLIFNRYLFREIIYTLFALTALLLLVYVSHRFMYYLIQASAGIISAKFIFQLVGLKLLSDLVLIIPLSLFLSILLTLGRLYKDNEITALAACGQAVPFNHIIIWGLEVGIVVACISLFIAPWARHQMDILVAEAANNEVSTVVAGQFREFKQGNGIFYIESIDPETDRMNTLFVQVNLSDKQTILASEQAYQMIKGEDLFFVFLNGQRYENKFGRLDYTISSFEEHTLKVPRQLEEYKDQSYKTLSISSLLKYSEPAYQAELQWRLSLPLSVVLLAALAVPMSRTTPRKGQYTKIFIGVLIYLIYNNLLNIAKKWLERGDIPSWLGLWWVHLLLLGLIVGLLYFPALKRWLVFKS